MSPSHPLKVLVSGASGFVAAWVVRAILERGHYVRGTVRSNSKGDYLKTIFKEHGDRFEYVIVEDVQLDGAFDEAVKGMDAVVHTASPFHLNADDPQELIGPAVQGTTAILESVLKFAPDVKRVVITSSTASVTDYPPSQLPPKHYTEKSWNNESPAVVKEKGRNAGQSDKYRASKTLAERAAWEFVDKHRTEIKWDLITLQPPFVFGPIIHEVTAPSSLNTSSKNFFNILKNDPPQSDADLAQSAGNYVDVRDVAWAHAEALVHDELANKDKEAAFNTGKGRITLVAGPFTWQDVIDAISASSTPLPDSTPRGKPGAGKATPQLLLVDSRRAREELGLKFTSFTDTFVDSLACFREKGWVS